MVKLNSLVQTMVPGLTELGKIKIGRKGSMRKSAKGNEFQPPEKLDHFIVTKLDRDPSGNFLRDDAIHELIGDKPKRIPVTLLFDEISMNFQSRFVCYQGKTLWCTGDGKQANRQGCAEPAVCPCERSEAGHEPAKDRCKINGVLSVIIRGAESVGGVWKFRTTSWNTVQGITSSLFLIQRITGGPLSGLDLDLVLAPKTATAPDGTTQTIYVVGIEYVGGMEKLRTAALQSAEAFVHHRKQLASMEDAAKDMMEAELVNEIAQDTVEEFYPEQVEGYQPPARATIDLGDGQTESDRTFAADGTEVNPETGEVIEAQTEPVGEGDAAPSVAPAPAPKGKADKAPVSAPAPAPAKAPANAPKEKSPMLF